LKLFIINDVDVNKREHRVNINMYGKALYVFQSPRMLKYSSVQ